MSITAAMKRPGGSITRSLSLVLVLACGSTLLLSAGIVVSLTSGSGQLAVMIGALSCILVFATWYASKRLVSGSLAVKPIRDLAESIREISASQDYAARVDSRFKRDEVAQLADNLNGLLERIEQHDQQVREACARQVQEEESRLAAAVVTRTRELRESNEQLQAAAAEAIASNAQTHEIIADMNHELRTPMNGVMGMAELLFTTGLTSQQIGYTRTILESSEDMLSLVNNILDFSKVEVGKLDRIDDQPFSPGECVEKVSQLLVARAEMKGLTLSHERANDLPSAILGDGKRLRQVLINIIGNAIKFTERGTIVVRTTLLEQVGDVSTIRFEVADTGIGIPREKLDLIFEEFTQADGSMTRRFGGTGLGLAISRNLVEMMQGTIGADSEPGAGSTFHFTVRLLPDPETRAVTVTASAGALRGLDALIVDDNATNRRIVRENLHSWGVRTTEAPSGPQALEALEAMHREGGRFALAVLDAQMPEMDGFELAERMKQDARFADLRVLMLTSAGRRGDGTRCREIGIEGYLIKPVAGLDLLTAIRKVLGQKLDGSAGDLITHHTLRESRRSLRVLLAEDNAVNRRVASRLLEKLGHDVVAVDDGTRVLELLGRESFDVVLMDVQMPELDGIEATTRIRHREAVEGGHIPIVALTAHAMIRDRDRCLAAGMDDYLSKPISRSELIRVLEGVAERVGCSSGEPVRG